MDINFKKKKINCVFLLLTYRPSLLRPVSGVGATTLTPSTPTCSKSGVICKPFTSLQFYEVEYQYNGFYILHFSDFMKLWCGQPRDSLDEERYQTDYEAATLYKDQPETSEYYRAVIFDYNKNLRVIQEYFDFYSSLYDQ